MKCEKLHVKAINQIFLVSLSLVSTSSFSFLVTGSSQRWDPSPGRHADDPGARDGWAILLRSPLRSLCRTAFHRIVDQYRAGCHGYIGP
jgi:hypothetical protein